MQSDSIELPYWRRIWQAIRDHYEHDQEVNLDEMLGFTKEDLFKGPAVYKPYDECSFDNCINKIAFGNKGELYKFLRNISQALNLEATTAWGTFINYVKFEYYGKVTDIEQIIQSEQCVKDLIGALWEFYTKERTYQLKTLNYILEKNYPNFNLVLGITASDVRRHLFYQLGYLINEISDETVQNCIELKTWVERNKAEQLQVLLSMVMAVTCTAFQGDEFVEMLSVFKMHKFALTPSHIDILRVVPSSAFKTIQDVEYAVFIAGVTCFWSYPDIWCQYKDVIQSLLSESISAVCSTAVPYLVWALLQFTLPLDPNKVIYNNFLYRYIQNSIDDHAFLQLRDIVMNPIFKDTLVGSLVKRSVVYVLDMLCLKFDSDKIYVYDGVMELLCELMKERKVVDICLNGNSEGVRSLLENSLLLFPFHFQPFTMIMQAMIGHQDLTLWVLRQLDSIKGYTTTQKQQVESSNKELVLSQTYRPFDTDELIFRPGCPIHVLQKIGTEFIVIQAAFEYFQVLNSILKRLYSFVLQQRTYHDYLNHASIVGLKFLVQILKTDVKVLKMHPVPDYIIEAVMKLLQLSVVPSVRNEALAKICTDAMVHLFPHRPDYVYKMMSKMNLIPQKFHFQAGDFITPYDSIIVSSLENELASTNECDFIMSYIYLLKYSVEINRYHNEIQVPALTILYLKAFPVFANDFMSQCYKKQRICIELMKIIHTILSGNRSNMSEEATVVYDSVLTTFLIQQIHFKSLVKIFEIGNKKFELLLIKEMDWKTGNWIQVANTISRALGCMQIILEHINTTKDLNTFEFIENYLYIWDKSRISVLRIVSGYISHTFDPTIPVRALNILQLFILISSKPLLPSLEIDNRQIRIMFLECLHNPIQDINFKIAILKFITTCVHTQLSITLSFFSIEENEDNWESNLVTYLSSYLEMTFTNPKSASVELQIAILELYCALWSTNKKQIIDIITAQQDFWSILTYTLFKPGNVNISIMVKVFDILVLELYHNQLNNWVLKNVVRDLQQMFPLVLNTCATCLGELSHTSKDVADIQLLITVWKKFLTAVNYVSDEQIIIAPHDPSLHKGSLLSLSHYMKQPHDRRMIKTWVELFILFYDLQVPDDASEIKDIYTETCNVICSLTMVYLLFDNSMREMLLILFLKVTESSAAIIGDYEELPNQFLVHLWKLFNYEEQYLTKMLSKQETVDDSIYTNLVIIIGILSRFIKLKNAHLFGQNFVQEQYLNRLLLILNKFIKCDSPTNIIKILLNALIEYAHSELVHHFDVVDMESFYETMIPPDIYLISNTRFPNGIIPKQLKTWWEIYSYVIRLNGILLQKRRGIFCTTILKFIYLHQEYLLDALSTATVLADSSNLKLVLDILHFVNDILSYNKKWTVEDPVSFKLILKSIKETLYTSIAAVLRPKMLIFIPEPLSKSKELNSSQIVAQGHIPHENMIEVTNNLIAIMAWSCICLIHTNPLFVFFADPYKSSYYTHVECDFRVPPIRSNEPVVLSYGTLLCALHFICKTLNQISLKDSSKTSETYSKADISSKSTTASTSKMSIVPDICTNLENQTTNLPIQKFNVIIHPSYTKDNLESLTALHHYLIPETLSLQAPWLVHIDEDNLLLALEALNTFLAGQAFTTVRDKLVDRTVMRYIRRELCSELLFFYDFVHERIQTKVGNISQSETSNVDNVIKPSSSLVSVVSENSNLVCKNKASEDLEKDKYLLLLTHWFRHICRLVHYSKFDEFLSQWHAKSTCVMDDNQFVKNTNVYISEDEDEGD